MATRHIGHALLLGADESLAALLCDVLVEVGITLQVGEAHVARPDLVLVQVGRGESVLSALQTARDGTYPAPVFVLLPFADERLMQRALRLGARGCFALGQPLDELRRMVLAVLPATGRSSSSRRVQ
ncbi:DNA-binding response regulator [Hyalangium versicolor]|uniref:DNA-binding response regulator n=1 Tax=Hyalangium versicolor TaxID=2861190 RepID=UPI001CCFAB69|nr:DNA-binding response regulator [Hyalangium versicolor]